MKKTMFCCICDGRDPTRPVQTLEKLYGRGASTWVCTKHALDMMEMELRIRAAFELRSLERIVYMLIWRA